METKNPTTQSKPSLADFRGLAQNMSPTSRVALAKDGGITTIGLWQRCKRFFTVSSDTKRTNNAKLVGLLKKALEGEYGLDTGTTGLNKLVKSPTILSARRINRILQQVKPSAKNPTSALRKVESAAGEQVKPSAKIPTSALTKVESAAGDQEEKGTKEKIEDDIKSGMERDFDYYGKLQGGGLGKKVELRYEDYEPAPNSPALPDKSVYLEVKVPEETDLEALKDAYTPHSKVDFPERTIFKCEGAFSLEGKIDGKKVIFVNENNGNAKKFTDIVFTRALFPTGSNFFVSSTKYNVEDGFLRVFLKQGESA